MAYLYNVHNNADDSSPYSASPSGEFEVSVLMREPSATLPNYWSLAGLRATDDWSKSAYNLFLRLASDA